MTNKHFNLSALATALLITTCQLCPAERSLDLIQFLSPGNSSLEGLNLLYSCLLSDDDRFFYSVSMDNNVLGVYSRNETTGELTQIQTVYANVPGVEYPAPDYACISPDSKNLYLLDYKSNTIFTYRRNRQSGTLQELQVLTDNANLYSVGYMDFTPDGKWAIATLYEGDGVAVLKRNSLNGTLTFSSSILNEDLPSVAIDGPSYLKVSPDGNFVYVCSFGTPDEYLDANIAIFSINNNTGELTFTGRVENGISTENFVGIRWLDITRDGKQLYAIAAYSDAVHLFDRNTTTGLLTAVNYWQDTERHDYPRVVILSPEENFVYVSGYDSNTLTQYRRNQTTGELSQPITWQNGPAASEKGFLNTRQIDITDDGKFLYTGGWPDYEDDIIQVGLEEYSGIGVFKITNTAGTTWVCH